MKFPLIESVQNPKVKRAISLRDRRERDEEGLFLIEGYREILRAHDAGWKLDTLFSCPELFLGSNEGRLIESIYNSCSAVYQTGKTVMHKLSYRDRPDGLVAIAPQRHLDLSHLETIIKEKKSPFLVVAETIEKPGNLGTILRCCDAVAADALILCDKCTDSFNPNVVRASVGTLFTVPVIEAKSSDALCWLKERKITIAAATPHAVIAYNDADLSGAIAIAMGCEQLGLSPLWMDSADICVRIPMLGVADSLNVAMATVLMLYESLRQRRS